MTDLEGRRCLVTGATSGIGRETARALAALGAEVIVHGRDSAAVGATCRSIVTSSPDARVSGIVADFGSLASVRQMASELTARHASIDVLVNNAAAVPAVRRTTADGYEWQLGVNHLAPFLLTNLLLGALQRSGAGRIVTVSSEAHRRARIDFDDLQSERGKYNAFRAYGASKLANILFTLELSRRLRGTGTTANSLHPGVVMTSIFRDAGVVVGAIIRVLGRWLMLSPAQGAATSVFLASSPDVGGVTGKYFVKCREHAPAPAATDAAAAARLWEISEQLTASAAEPGGSAAGAGRSP
jgi:NAD(P)-dependent dehydrogenase (short-subunit alcohol dehydrogenase family)